MKQDKLHDHFLSIGFKTTSLPWRYELEYEYTINVLDTDSYGLTIYSISNKRYDEIVYRGRIRDEKEFDQIFRNVKEDYNLSEEEKQLL